MTFQDFKSKAHKEESNTTNGWGFGGHVGHKYTLGKFSCLLARWSYRHAPSSTYERFYIEDKEVRKAEFEAAIQPL